MAAERLWQPSADQIAEARMSDFLQQINVHNDAGLANYHELYQWSIDNNEAFWSLIWDYFDVIGEKGDVIVQDKDKLPGAKWFPEAELNFAENLLRHKDNHSALVFRGENGERQELSYEALYLQVARAAHALKTQGVSSGDRVAGMMPNCIETIVMMLATTSLGAIWSSCSPDFGVQGVLDRFGQIEPKVLMTVDGYFYNQKNLNI
ncbi:MAG: acetoacetate--CoA ligase, partial [Idiomarina sp.]|nr:acetoacetate--CoA ligase [Idiomarina sp.]